VRQHVADVDDELFGVRVHGDPPPVAARTDRPPVESSARRVTIP
jgi:hypothetical protein